LKTQDKKIFIYFIIYFIYIILMNQESNLEEF